MPTANFNFTSACLGDPTQFTNTSTTNPSGQQIDSYQWNFGDGQTSNQQNPSHQYASAGTYTVTLTVSTGGHCTSTKTQTVTVYAQPAANAGPDQTIAYGSTAQLSGSGGAGTFNFHWEPANMVSNPNAQNTQTVSLTQDQTYTLTVTNPQGGCSSTDEVTIHISGSAMTVTAGPNISICQGGSGQIYVNAGGGTGNISYSWTPTTGLSNPNIYNPIASPSQTTTYTCTVNDGQTTQSVSVTVTVNDVIVENESMTICPDDIYHWHGAAYTEVGTYQFDTVTDQGCEKTIYLHLDHYPSYDETIIEEAICFGETYTFYGNTYDYSIQTSYTDHTIHGCDSIVRLNLTVYPNNGVTDHPVTVCESQLPFYYEEDPNQIPLYAGDHLFHLQDSHGCDSIVVVQLSVSNYYIPPTQTEYVCYDDEPSFYWDVNGQTYHTSGLHVDTIPYSDCEGIFSLDLNFQKTPERIVFDTVVCDSIFWPVTGLYYSQTDNYHHWVSLSPFPCYQEYQLNLIVNYEDVDNHITFDGISGTHLEGIDNIEGINEGDPVPCDSIPFPWFGETLYLTKSRELDSVTPQGCNYQVDIIVKNLQYTPQPEIYCPDLNIANPHWPITATEFNVNRYTYRVTDTVSDISRWNLGKCEWEISKNSWRIVPNPSGSDPLECIVYAMDWVPDSICLSFKAVNSCSGNEGVIAEYWLHPSFYGVEEQEAYPASVSVIPNPNNGQMRLQFDNMQGDLNIKVYSLTGTLVDAFELKSIEVGQSHEYSMKRLMNGIYFFTISDGKRSVTKKVVVIH
jgi:PKD repeat protein